MKRYRETELLVPVMAAYIAGPVDGEGTVTLTRPHREVSSRQALSLLGQIAPYMRSYKSERVRLALRYYVGLTPRNGKYRPDIRKARDEFEARLLPIRA
ncbi:MAG: hypothetical protein EPO27_20900 [Betaproteobacteria bacterium]|nr:MAG: hypothetical protein EPO27_20900 [Betaproteobacteria bacterium]